MTEFKKYNSIENTYNKDFLEKIEKEGYESLLYVVQEKVHGANCCFITDGTDVGFAKRTGPVLSDEKFYNYEELLSRYREKVRSLFTLIKVNYPTTSNIMVYGEMFGGNYPHAFQSRISEWLGLPPIENNTCEGIVIRPVEPVFLKNGSRMLLKNKNSRFAEKKSVKKRQPALFVEPGYSEELLNQLLIAEDYVTENRLNNVISKVGEVSFPNDAGKLIGLLSKDVLEDFLKEHSGSYAGLEKSEQKIFNRHLNKLSVELIKKVYMSS